MKYLYFLITLLLVVFTSNIFAQDSLTFNSLADMTTNRYGFGYTYDGEFIYAVSGGKNISPYNSSSMEMYNLSNNTWTEIRNDLIPRRYVSAEYISSLDNIYIFNGHYYGSNPSIAYTDTIEIYNVTSGTLSYSTSNPFPVEYAGSAVWNNKIYVFGGSNSSGSSNRLYEYNPENDQWTRLADMPEAKQTSGRIVDGKLYVFGGYNGSVSKRIDMYDIQTNTWTFIGEMPVAISAHGTAVLGKYIWLVGSYNDLKFLALFDTGTYKFTQFYSNMTGRRHAGTIANDDSLYIFGGNQTSASSSALNSMEVANVHEFITSITQDIYGIPVGYNLYQNYPNPFNPETTIEFSIAKPEKITLTVFNILGKKVASLVNQELPSGTYKFTFSGNNLPSGTYFYKLICSSGYSKVRKMLILK